MDLKNSNIKIGLIDFFSVLLPGMLLLYFMLKMFEGNIDLNNFQELTKTETREWVAFILTSYIIGHLLFATGSKLDGFYDYVFRKRFEKNSFDLAFLVAQRLKLKTLNEEIEKEFI